MEQEANLADLEFGNELFNFATPGEKTNLLPSDKKAKLPHNREVNRSPQDRKLTYHPRTESQATLRSTPGKSNPLA